jgi:hypothetical protein
MTERQVIVTWYTPAEKLPEEDISVVATVSGKAGSDHFHHAMVTLYYSKKSGWYSIDFSFDYLIVHAWCDLEPYNG